MHFFFFQKHFQDSLKWVMGQDKYNMRLHFILIVHFAEPDSIQPIRSEGQDYSLCQDYLSFSSDQ